MAKEPPVLQRQELAQVSAPVDYATPSTQAALTPTALGNFGLNIAQNAANQRATMLGLENGKSPHGELFPAITQSDEYYKKSYESQSHATLSLKAMQLMDSAQLSLARSNKITPELINSYESQVSQGLQDIFENAPTGVKESLQNQYANNLIQSSQGFRLKMIAQDKEQSQTTIRQDNQSQIENVFNNAYYGNEETGSLYKTQKNKLKNYLDTQQISRKEYDSNIRSLKLAYYTGQFSRQSDVARDEGKLEEWMKNFISYDYPDISPLEKSEIAKGVFSHITEKDSWNKKDEVLTLSQLNYASIGGQLDQGMIYDAESKVPKSSMLNWKAKYIREQRGLNNKKAKIAQTVNSWGKAEEIAPLTPDQKNQAASELLNSYMQQNPNADPWEAKTIIAATAGAPIPSYINALNLKMKKRNVRDMREAVKGYDTLWAQNPALVSSVDSDAKRLMFIYNSQVQDADALPEDALETAFNSVYGLDEDQKKSIDKWWNEKQRNFMPTFSDKINYAIRHTNAEGAINNPESFANRFHNLLTANVQKMGGDYDAALKLTSHEIESTWSDSYVNNTKEYTNHAIERAVGIDPSNVGLIQSDAKQQLMVLLKPSNDAYETGNLDYKFKLKDETRIDDIIAKSNRANELENEIRDTPKTKQKPLLLELRNVRQELRKAKSSQDMTLIREFRNGTKEEYDIHIVAGHNLSIGNVDNEQTLGGYDFRFAGKNGRYQPLMGINTLTNKMLYYRPNLKSIKNAYRQINSIDQLQEWNHQQAVDAAKRADKNIPLTAKDYISPIIGLLDPLEVLGKER